MHRVGSHALRPFRHLQLREMPDASLHPQSREAPMKHIALAAVVALTVTAYGQSPQTSVVRGWGGIVFDTALNDVRDFVAVAASAYHTVALRANGSIVGWGGNGSGELNVPALPPGLTYVEIAAGSGHTMVRRSNGS